MTDKEKIFRLLVEMGDSKKNIDEVNIILEVLRLRVDTVTKVIKIFNDEISSETIQTLTQLDKATLTVTASKKRLTDEEKEANKIAKLQKDVNDAEEGSLKQLNAQVKLNSFEYSKMSKEKREGTEAGRLLGKELKAQRNEVRELTMATGDNTRNIGNYKDALGGLTGIFTKVTTGLGGVAALFGVVKPMIDSTQTSSDAFAITVAEVNSKIELLHKSLSTADFSLFRRNLIDATTAARELAKALDDAFERQNSIDWLKSEDKVKIAQLKEIARDATKTREQQKAALIEIQRLTKEGSEREISLATELADKRADDLFAQIKGAHVNEQNQAAEKVRFLDKIKNYDKERDKINAIKQLIEDTNDKTVEKSDYTDSSLMVSSDKANAAKKELAELRKQGDEWLLFVEQYERTNDEKVKTVVDSYIAINNATGEASSSILRETTALNNKINQDRQDDIAAAKKTSQEAATTAKEQVDTEFAIMEAGRAKDIQAVERDYSDKRAKLKNNAEGLKQLEIWKIGELQKVNDKYDNEALQKLDAQQSFMLSIMEEGTQKELYALNIEYTKKLAVATKNGYDTIKVEEWKQEQLDKIARKARDKEGQPENMRSDKLIKARQDYELQQQIINGSQVSPLEKQKNNVANELQYLQVRYDIIKTYIAEAQAMQTTQGYSQEREEQIQKALGMLNTLQVNIDSVTSEANQTSAFAKMLGIDDDSAEMLKTAAFNLATQVNNAIADAEKQSVDRRLRQETQRIDDGAKSEKKILDDKRKRGLISEKTYQKELEKVDAEAEKRRTEADKKAFEDKKRIDTKAAIINTALSIGNALATVKPFMPTAIIAAGIAAASGAVQIATIQSQKYALGGVIPVGESSDGISMGQVKGPSHAQGGLRIMIGGKPVGEMEGDEIFAIINKTSSNRYLPQLSKINQAGGGVKFADGGLVSMSALPLTSSYTQSMGMPVNFNAFGRFSLDRLPTPAPIPNYRIESERLNNEHWESMKRESDARFAAMIDKIETIATQKVYVVESDISDAQKSVANIKKAAIF